MTLRVPGEAEVQREVSRCWCNIWPQLRWCASGQAGRLAVARICSGETSSLLTSL